MSTNDLKAFQPVHNLKPYKRVEGIHQIEHFFRTAAELDVDKEDIKRYYEFVDQKMPDLLLIAQNTAKSSWKHPIDLRVWNFLALNGRSHKRNMLQSMRTELKVDGCQDHIAV
ncbi:MAG TPA: DUF1931 family protein [Acidobacteriaceae bacterium]|jgi:DNA-binding transcriptional regulator PaaX|nr:DUF1931 family protein [Acidobacteriaceae bacterium]